MLHHSWAVELLPWVDRNDIAQQWNMELPVTDPANQILSSMHVSVLACPDDISVVRKGDLSYVVNGGFGWTSVVGGVGDCPIGPDGISLDLNGNAVVCPSSASADGQPSDRDLFLMTGMFFIESWKTPGSQRHHRPDSILDGLSHTKALHPWKFTAG